MENRKIIKDSTPENSPEVLIYGRDNLKKVFKRDEKLEGSDEYNLIPRSYADALEVFPVIRGHWKNNTGSRLFPLSDELSDEAYKFFFQKGSTEDCPKLLCLLYDAFCFPCHCRVLNL